MAVPRPLLLIPLGTVLLAVTFMALRNSTSASEKASAPAPPAKAPAAPQPAEPAQPAQPKLLEGADAVRAIVSPGSRIKSATFSMRMSSQELGRRSRPEVLAARGAFAAPAANQVDFDVVARSAGEEGRQRAHM